MPRNKKSQSAITGSDQRPAVPVETDGHQLPPPPQSSWKLMPGAMTTTILLLILLPLSTAIKCWDCNSMINKGCDDPFKPDDFAMADCSQKHLARFPDKEGNVCRKTLQKINDEYRVIRGCGYINDTFDTIPPGADIDDQCFRRTGTFSVMVEYCICNTGDGCNAAMTVKTPYALMVAAIIIAIIPFV